MTESARLFVKRATAIGAFIAAVFAVRVLPVGEWLDELAAWAAANPVLGPTLFIGMTMLGGVAALPGWIPMMLAGLVFGFFPGVLYATLGIVAAATAALIVGRTLLRGWAEKRIAGNPRMLALDAAVHEQGFLIVVLTRLALVIPFNLLNYAYGLTRVDTRLYVVATTVGMLPAVATYVYLGTLARDIDQILEGEAEIKWAAAVGVVALIAVVFTVRRTVKKALDRQLNSGNAAP